MTQSTEPSDPNQAKPDADFDAAFAKLVADVEKGRKAPFKEPPGGSGGGSKPPKDPEAARRVWPRNVAIAVTAGALVVGGVLATRHKSPQGAAKASAASTAHTATPNPNPSASSVDANASTDVGAGADVDASAGAGATGAVGLGAASQIPISQLYPKTVHGPNGSVYTLVTAGPLHNCIDSDMVGPTLAGLFARSNGCAGGEGALYKDSSNDQFNMTVFTLKDPVDVITIVNDLAMDQSDFEVGALQPPAGSGLTALSATSGIIQQFGSAGHYMGVFMAQWSDGRTADYGSLQDLLTPLQNNVSATMQSASRSGA